MWGGLWCIYLFRSILGYGIWPKSTVHLVFKAGAVIQIPETGLRGQDAQSPVQSYQDLGSWFCVHLPQMSHPPQSPNVLKLPPEFRIEASDVNRQARALLDSRSSLYKKSIKCTKCTKSFVFILRALPSYRLSRSLSLSLSNSLYTSTSMFTSSWPLQKRPPTPSRGSLGC